jgi:hypothetical protein
MLTSSIGLGRDGALIVNWVGPGLAATQRNRASAWRSWSGRHARPGRADRSSVFGVPRRRRPAARRERDGCGTYRGSGTVASSGVERAGFCATEGADAAILDDNRREQSACRAPPVVHSALFRHCSTPEA